MRIDLEKAKQAVYRSKTAFCKFIAANDAGATGAHQEGFYIPKNSISLMFDEPGVKGTNKDRFVRIRWQDSFETDSRFIYYGQKSRNEYRLTRFGKGFPFLKEENVGDLFILCHIIDDYYEGYVLQTDDDIEDFFTEFNISASETNQLINKSPVESEENILQKCFAKYINSLKIDFPSSIDLASQARLCYNQSNKLNPEILLKNPDKNLLGWINTEFELFKTLENDRYKELLIKPFDSITEFIDTANTILNRRKSRAGKSLEHHLSEMFSIASLKYESQVITEENKKPDFIFPNRHSYFDEKFNENNLIFLASKTTCKDRWRQILNEADRIKIKHLFTLQQGISLNQLQEMYKYQIQLVVPDQFISTFPIQYRDKIMNLDTFIRYVQSKQ